MLNKKMLKSLAAVCAVLLLSAAIVNQFSVARAEQYNIGDAEITAPVRNLEINWTSGAVNIAYHSGSSILISEKTTGVTGDDMRMHWRLDGDTLQIEFDKPGFHLFSIFNGKKELTVTLPQELILQNASIHLTSGELTVPSLRADTLQLKSTSGDMRCTVSARILKGDLTSGNLELKVMNKPEEISLHSTSGDILFEAEGAENKILIDTTSGGIRAAVKETEAFTATSTSGAIHAVLGSVKKTEIGSTSGNIQVEISAMEALKIHATSGNVTACLPSVPGFTATIETTSGRIEHQLPMAKQGKDYVVGDGSAAVNIHTTSGSVTVAAKEN